MTPLDLSTVVPFAEHAPSVLNTQPWSCAVVGGTIEVRADRSRGLAVLDPTGRQLAISCGAALEFAEVAVRGLGWTAVTGVLPDPGDPDLIGVVRPGTATAPDADGRGLLTAITRRFTDRGTYGPQPVTATTLTALRAGVERRGAWLRVLDHPGDRLAVIQALNEAETIEAADAAYRQETAGWLRTRPALDGIPTAALMLDPTATEVTDVPTRDFHGRNDHPRPGGERAPLVVERDLLLMIGTPADTLASWVDTGRALGWLQLRLTVEGLASQPLGQLIDIEAARARIGAQLGLMGHVQFVLRVGAGHGRPRTRRRSSAPTAAVMPPAGDLPAAGSAAPRRTT